MCVMRMGMDPKPHFVGDEAIAKRGILRLHYPISEGLVTEWNHFEKVVCHAIYNEMKVTPEERICLLSEPPGAPDTQKAKILEILFETFNIPGTMLMPSSSLVAFAADVSDCVVLQCGHDTSTSIVVQQWKSLAETLIQTNLAGRSIDEMMLRCLDERGVNLAARSMPILAMDMKEKHCYLSMNFDDELIRADAIGDMGIEYELPDGTAITLEKDSFVGPECLFRPHLLGAEEGETLSVPQVVSEALHQFPSSGGGAEKIVVVSGGSSLLRGFDERLEHAIRRLNGEDDETEFRLLGLNDRKRGVCDGGFVWCSLDSSRKKWVDREKHYDEDGVDRCVLLINSNQ